MMESFLETAKRSVQNLAGKKLHVVLGNQSCDLDSIICSLAYAFFRSKDNDEKLVVPVLDIARERLALRPEVAIALRELGIAVEALLCVGDMDLKAVHSAGNLSVTLVDHNAVAEHLTFISSDVIEVIDHHQEQTARCTDISYTVEMVGSCTTLVAEQILASFPDLVTEPLAAVMLGTILLDTVNLDAEAGRAKEKDREIADLLGEICGQEKGQSLYHSLRHAKFNMKTLTSVEMLGHDYKPVQSSSQIRLGISSVTMDLVEFFSRTDVLTAFDEYVSKLDLTCLVVMAIFFPEGSDLAQRQVAVFSKSTKDQGDVVGALQSGSLHLSPLHLATPHENIMAFSQGNRSASRKVVLPLLAQKLHEIQGPAAPDDVSSMNTTTDSTSAEGAALLGSASAAAVLPETSNARAPSPLPEYSPQEEAQEERQWRAVGVEGVESSVDMAAIESYRRIITHGGYRGPDSQAVIVLSACYLPEKNIGNYQYVMDQLFLYTVSTIQHLAVDKFCLIYFNSGTGRRNTPGIGWLKKYYQCLDRRLRKNLQELFIVHPSLRLKVLVHLTRPFISSKFWRKLRFVQSLTQLRGSVKLENIHIPPAAVLLDRERDSTQPEDKSEEAGANT